MTHASTESEEKQAGVPLPTETPVITVDAARRYYGLSRSAMYDAVNRGDIPSLRIGRRLLIPVAAIRRQLGLEPAS